MIVEFEIVGHPKGQRRPQAYYRRPKKGATEPGRAGVYDPPLDVDWKNLVFGQVVLHRPPAPLEDVPFRLTCVFKMPMPKTWPKYLKAAVADGETVYHLIDPDLDQLIKPIQDMMKHAGFYLDDNQVAHYGDSRKIYGVQPGVLVRLETLEQGGRRCASKGTAPVVRRSSSPGRSPAGRRSRRPPSC